MQVEEIAEFLRRHIRYVSDGKKLVAVVESRVLGYFSLASVDEHDCSRFYSDKKRRLNTTNCSNVNKWKKSRALYILAYLTFWGVKQTLFNNFAVENPFNAPLKYGNQAETAKKQPYVVVGKSAERTNCNTENELCGLTANAKKKRQ